MKNESVGQFAIAAALGLALASTSAAAGPAISALASAPAAAGPAISASVNASGPHTNAVVSSYLAGYQITKPGISHAGVSFTVPTVNCPTSDTQGSIVGVGDEQTSGSPTLYGSVWLACVGGSPDIIIDVRAGGNSNTGSASPGDKIVITVNQTKKNVSVTVTNVTTATKTTATGTPLPDTTLVYGSLPLFSGGVTIPVADFGLVRLKAATLENAPLAAWAPTALVRKDGTTTQIRTTAFNAGGAFEVQFIHN